MDSDLCTAVGAKRLAETIQHYWRKRGYDVDVKLVDAGFSAAMRSTRTDVRSDMVDGMPRRVLLRNARVSGVDDIEL